MRRRTIFPTIIFGTLGLAACADTMAPTAPSAFQPSDASKNVTVATGSGTVPFSITACNGDLVVGNADHHVVAINATGKKGSADLVAVLDHLVGVGTPSSSSYEGLQLTADAALISPNVTAFTTVSAVDLKGKGKTPDTYVDIVTLFVMGSDGQPALSKVYYSTRCSNSKPPSHW
jgi:hypothetical protein